MHMHKRLSLWMSTETHLKESRAFHPVSVLVHVTVLVHNMRVNASMTAVSTSKPLFLAIALCFVLACDVVIAVAWTTGRETDVRRKHLGSFLSLSLLSSDVFTGEL